MNPDFSGVFLKYGAKFAVFGSCVVLTGSNIRKALPWLFLCSHHPGFRQLKLVKGPRGVSCFIEFADVTTGA